MEFLIIYIYTMLITTVISLYNNEKQKRRKKFSFWVKIILIIPAKGNEPIPVYLIIIHGVIQIMSFLCIVCLNNNVISKQLCQELYGGCMVGLIVILTIICNKLAKA